MKFEGISFNALWIKSKTLKEFLAEARINKHWLEGDPKRLQKLTELYHLVNPQNKSANPGNPDPDQE